MVTGARGMTTLLFGLQGGQEACGKWGSPCEDPKGQRAGAGIHRGQGPREGQGADRAEECLRLESQSPISIIEQNSRLSSLLPFEPWICTVRVRKNQGEETSLPLCGQISEMISVGKKWSKQTPCKSTVGGGGGDPAQLLSGFLQAGKPSACLILDTRKRSS